MSVGTAGSAKKRGELGSIQFLRFLASSLVVLFHTEVQLYRLSEGARDNHVPFASYGTDLFFVISGFVMVYITYDKTQGFAQFMKRRIVRIVPLYWLYTCCLILLWWLWRAAFNSTALEFWHAVASFAFLPYPHPVLGLQQPLMPVGWTLNYYMLFYLVFAAFLFLAPDRRILAVSAVLISLVVLQYFVGADAGLLKFYGASVELEFVYGMLVAWIFLRSPKTSVGVRALAVSVAVIVFVCGVWRGVSEGGDRAAYWGLSAAALLLACLLQERDKGWIAGNISQRLGNASYSIFLSNLFSLGAAGLLLRHLHAYEVLGGGAVQALLLVIAISVGYFAHIAVERPLMAALKGPGPASWTQRLLRRQVTAVPVSATASAVLPD